MNEFDQFISKIVDGRGINTEDRELLRKELLDYLNSSKVDNLKLGLNEQEAINKAIESFGNINDHGNNLKHLLLSNNKKSCFNIIDILKTIALMFIIYFIILFTLNATTLIFYSKGYNLLLSSIPIIIGTLYTLLKFYKKEVILYFLYITLSLFFCISNLFEIIFDYFSYYLRNAISLIEIHFNIEYIISYIITTIIIIIIIKITPEKFLKNIRSLNEYSINSFLLFIISILLMMVYYLFPNKCYPLYVIISKLFNNKDIICSTKNIFVMILNDNILIPNLGLFILLFLIYRIIRRFINKGFRSII